MKSFFVFCVVLVTGIQSAAVYVPLPPAQNEKANNIAYACIKETGVSAEAIIATRNRIYPDDERLRKFALCFFIKAEIVDSDGKLDIDVAIAKLPPGIDKDATRKILEGCKSITGKDAAETVFEMYKCYVTQTKVYIKVGPMDKVVDFHEYYTT